MTSLHLLPDGSMLDITSWPLPDGLTDGLLNRAQLATAFGVSENTITKWVAQGMPVDSEGQNGVAYSFQLSHCWAWRQSRDDQVRQKKQQGDDLAQQAALAFRNLDEDQVETHGRLTAKELRELAEADYHRNRAAEQRGELVRADRVRTAFQDVLVSVRTAMTTLPDYAEREFSLSNDQVATLQARCDDVLIRMRQVIEDTVASRREDVVDLAPPQQDNLAL